MPRIAGTALIALAMLGTGCGKYVQDSGRSPAQPIIMSLTAASGATPNQFGGTLFSDVITNVNRTVNGQQTAVPTVFADIGQVVMSMTLKDPGTLGVTSAPTALNQITFTRYHVAYTRSDGHNVEGVDIPFAFDGATTFTLIPGQNVTATFELVRHVAKEEAPLLALQSSPVIITTITNVTFYGQDQAGNAVSTTGSIQIDFGNFGDPS